MSIRVIASDSKLHYRPSSSGNPFRGLIGVTLGIKDPDSFKEKYIEIFEKFFEDNMIKKTREVYKAYEIAKMFPGTPTHIRGIFRKIVGQLFLIEDVNINVYYFTLNLHSIRRKKVEDFLKVGITLSVEEIIEKGEDAKIIQLFGEPGSDALSYISMKGFFEKVSQYYPIICSHALTSYLSLQNCEILMDGCSGYETKAWRELIATNNTISIAPHGDEYNPFLSSCDLIVRWIDEELKQSRLPLNGSALERLLHDWYGMTRDIDTEHIRQIQIGNRDLATVKPISKKTMNYFEHIHRKHPTFYIFQENREESERKNVEMSPAMAVIINRVFSEDGSYCFWKPDKHARHIIEGDVAVIYGNSGFDEANRLKSLGYPINVWDLRIYQKEPS